MSEPFFSIVIPTYNRADFLGKTICSLFEQSFFLFEIIVVDDGSTDNTEEIIQPFLLDPRVYYYKKENGERGAARNFGASKAKGRYINFFDSDDLAYPNHLLEAHQVISQRNVPEVFHLGYDIKSPDGRKWRNVNELPHLVNQKLINGNHLSCNGVFIRKDIAIKHPFSENRELSASEDYALWIHLAAHYPIHCNNVITSTIVNHEQRSVVNINLEKFLLRMEILKNSIMNDTDVYEKYKGQWNEFLAYRDIYIALHLGMAKCSRLISLKYLLLAIQTSPQTFLTRRFFGALKNILL